LVVLSGFNRHTIRLQVLNRKTGELEEKDHVWVCTGGQRQKFDESKNERQVAKSSSVKDPTAQQIQETCLTWLGLLVDS